MLPKRSSDGQQVQHIIRVERHDRCFTQIHNTAINDRRLKYGPLGLLLYLISRVEDWEVYIGQLATAHNCGRDAVRSYLRALEECGYARRWRSHDARGHAVWVTKIFETPDLAKAWDKQGRLFDDRDVGKSDAGKPDVGKSDVGKPDATNNRTEPTLTSTKTESNNTAVVGDRVEVVQRLVDHVGFDRADAVRFLEKHRPDPEHVYRCILLLKLTGGVKSRIGWLKARIVDRSTDFRLVTEKWPGQSAEHVLRSLCTSTVPTLDFRAIEAPIDTSLAKSDQWKRLQRQERSR